MNNRQLGVIKMFLSWFIFENTQRAKISVGSIPVFLSQIVIHKWWKSCYIWQSFLLRFLVIDRDSKV